MKPSIRELRKRLDLDALGDELHGRIVELYPICRSITGDGVRRTLKALQEVAPLEIREVASGTQVFDWTVPPEWNIRAGWIKGPDGRKVVDFDELNLHVLNYSAPVHKTVGLDELREHVFTDSEHPELVPYRTSYYQQRWAFCMSESQLMQLEEGDYEVFIDSTLAEDGHLSYGEGLVRGASADEVLISTHICHPSLCNDNLSGLVVTAALARCLESLELRYSYRFLFIPGTIGSITWLALNKERTGRIRHGLVASGLGDEGVFHYKQSRRGDAEIDRAVLNVLRGSQMSFEVLDFVPFGYDERQYCSPGFNLPVGSLTRTPYGCYPEYHTSGDNPDFVKAPRLAESVDTYLQVLAVLEGNRKYRNLNPHCEPQLGRRGLYRLLGGSDEGRAKELALLWVLNLSDTHHDLLAISDRARVPFDTIREAADALLEAGLIEESG